MQATLQHPCSDRCATSTGPPSSCKCKCGGASHGSCAGSIPAVANDGVIIRTAPAPPAPALAQAPGALSDQEVTDLFGGERLVVHDRSVGTVSEGVVVGTGFDYRDPTARGGGGWGPVAVVLGDDDHVRIAPAARLTRSPTRPTQAHTVGATLPDGARVIQDRYGEPALTYKRGQMDPAQSRALNRRVDEIAWRAADTIGDSDADDPGALASERQRYVAAIHKSLLECPSFTAGAAAGIRHAAVGRSTADPTSTSDASVGANVRQAA